MAWSVFRGFGVSGKQSKKLRRSRRQPAKRRRTLFEELENRNMLAVLTVNSALDNVTGGDGLVTLREAIIAANNDALTDLGDTGSGADIIRFDAALNGQTITLGGTALDIEESLSINPTNAVQLTIDAATNSRVFNITDIAGDVSLRGLTMTNGDAGAGNNGGAIHSLSLGVLSLANSSVTGSTGANGGGVFAVGSISITDSSIGGPAAGQGNTADGSGGGVYSEANVTIKNSTVSGNHAVNDGGGVYADTLLIDSSTIGGLNAADANTADGDGGGVSAGTLTVQYSTIAGNRANGQGGGAAGVTVSIKNSTLSGNTADTGVGGGVNGYNVMVRNSTIAGNEATLSDGGGVSGNRITVQGSTITDNNAGDDGGGVFATNRVTVHNSIIVGNTAADSPDLRVPGNRTVRFSLIGRNEDLPADAQFAVTGVGAPNGSGNLVGDGAAMAIAVDNAFGVGGGTLGNNGGTTQTVALLAGAIAIDRGANALAVDVNKGDQRGLPFDRISPFAGSVDMGAFELQTVTPGNVAPVVANPIADQNSNVGNFYSFTFPANTFTDADGDALTYGAMLAGGGALPAWLTFDPVSRTFSGTPAVTDVAVLNIRLTASDGHANSASDDFMLTVATDPPPVVAVPIPDQNAPVGIPFTFTFDANTFTDPQGDPLTYSASLAGGGALPAWLSFNAGTRTFSGTPAAGDIGVVNVRVTATDPTFNAISDDFAINVAASELPFNENFEGALDARIQQKTGQIALTNVTPITGTQSLRANRLAVGSRPLATVDFVDPATAGQVTNISVDVSTETGNGSSLWSNAIVSFDYQSPTNYKFAGVFEIIDRLIIGQVVNGRVTYLAQRVFPAAPNTTIPLNVAIDRVTRQVTLTSGATTVSHTFSSLGTGTVGVGTINANARFDSLVIT
jgi:hypothetical protein